MPILKEPVVHYFGVVSDTEHEKLQLKVWEKYLRNSSGKTKTKKEPM